MTTKRLDREKWASFFDQISKGIGAKQVTVEVASPSLGDQTATHGVSLSALSFDARNDVFEISVTGLNHMVQRPTEIYVLETGAGRAAAG